MTHRPSPIRLGVLGAAALLLAACSKDMKSQEPLASGATSGSAKAPPTDVNPAAVQALAKAPAPPSNATRQATIGMGKAAIKTANTSGESDSVWVEEIDVDGDGAVEETQLLWDDEDKVLFAYAETDVPCDMGGTATAALLIGVNGKGNLRGRPEGSGFYAVYLDATECGAIAAGLFGARFDARGYVTACGEVVINEDTDEITIVAARR